MRGEGEGVKRERGNSRNRGFVVLSNATTTEDDQPDNPPPTRQPQHHQTNHFHFFHITFLPSSWATRKCHSPLYVHKKFSHATLFVPAKESTDSSACRLFFFAKMRASVKQIFSTVFFSQRRVFDHLRLGIHTLKNQTTFV